MIEPVMFFGIGFLVAALLGLLFVPLVHNRAVRLTMRRLEAATPLSIAEIRADKDQLRAEFAMSTRRLEMSVEQMKARTTGQLAELGKKTDAINQLKKELGEKTAAIFALESRDKNPARPVARHRGRVRTSSPASLREAERTLADKQADLAKLVAELGERSIMADSQRVELAAMRTQVEAMKVSVTDYERAVRATEERLDARTRRSRGRDQTVERSARQARRTCGSAPANSSGSLWCRRPKPKSEPPRPGARNPARRSGPALGRARIRDRPAARRTRSRRQDRARFARRAREFRQPQQRRRRQFRADIGQLEAQLAAAVEERTKLQREIGAMKRDAETTWAAERVENALLRERINDVAAEVARLTAVLEGPGSPIESMLAEAVPTGGGRRDGADRQRRRPSRSDDGSMHRSENKGTLADRIRALQSTASRVASTN